ncbi:hypothetical protein B0H14DRAFT_2802565 [Mycena olivaceomarginata]|nr:hypothetical protein B0H14DRAFT_2802565 [Mycena olivaceomarginata]
MIGLILQFFAATVLLSYTVLAVTPIVASTTNYGSLITAGLNRDSCSSSLWSNNVPISDRQPVFPIVANTASFSSFPSDRHNRSCCRPHRGLAPSTTRSRPTN